MSFDTSHVYGQLNPQWKNVKLGKSKPKDGTIGNYGCTITAITNLHNILFGTNLTPLDVNKLFIENNVFVLDKWGYSVVNWLRVGAALPRLNFVYRDQNYNNLLVWTWIKIFPQVPVIGVVRISVNVPQHFLLMIGDGKLVDSLDGRIKPTSTYSTYIGSARFTKTS